MIKKHLILSWALRIVVAIGFLLASLGKLSDNPAVIQLFDNWGFPSGFHFVIGILELSLAILILIPQTLKIALTGLSILMIGAFATHLFHDPFLQLLRPSIFLVFLASIYYLHHSYHKPRLS